MLYAYAALSNLWFYYFVKCLYAQWNSDHELQMTTRSHYKRAANFLSDAHDTQVKLSLY